MVSLLGFSTINIPLSSQSIFFTIFFCSYLKTSALASITWTRFIFPPEEALMLMDIMNAQRLFLYRERTAMISSARDGWKLLSLIQHIREHVNWIKLTNELNSKFFAAQNFKVKFGKYIKIAFLSVYPMTEVVIKLAKPKYLLGPIGTGAKRKKICMMKISFIKYFSQTIDKCR